MQDSDAVGDVAAVVAEIEERHGDVVTMWGSGLIVLAPHAEAVARDLHRRLGDQVAIVLGARRYPSGSWWPEEPGTGDPAPDDPLAGTAQLPDWLGVEVDAPATMVIGPDRFITATITNRGPAEVVVVTAGPPAVLDGHLVAPRGSVALSTPGGARHMMAIPTTVFPGDSVQFPAVFGVGATWYSTGYTVAPGDYELKLIVPATEARYSTGGTSLTRYRTDGIPLTVQPD
jgi:hypothetical protein